MIHLKHCNNLIKHTRFLTSALEDEHHFIVGGAIRDILLGITDDPTDIDVTMAGTPQTLLESLTVDEKTISMFTTEKFGTTTLIPKQGETVGASYEITPFRTESGYADNRHPDTIERSNDLLADSNRRDFTINCIYWTVVTITASLDTKTVHHPDKSLSLLASQGAVFDCDNHCLVIQNHALITECFTEGVPDLEALIALLQKVPHSGENEEAIAYTDQPLSVLIDPHHGINDLEERTIQTVGNATDRFEEDALRVIRGARFAITLNTKISEGQQQNSGFDFRKKTRQAMIEKAPLVSTLSYERLNQEITKVFQSPNPFGFISILRDLSLIEHIFPALAGTINNEQPTRHHPFDTYNHTLLTLYHIQQLNDDPLVKFAMLYHDVGKPDQYEFMEKAIADNPDNPDRTDYEAHPEISVRLMKQDFKRLCFSKKEIETIDRYITYHHRPGEILDAKEANRTKKLRKLLSDGGLDMALNLIDIVIADRLGQYNPLQPAVIGQVEQLKLQLQELHDNEGRFTKADLAVGGNDLMEAFDLAPGPELGELLDKAFEWVLADVKKRNEKEVLLKYLKGLIK